jgi:hypothetical protein
MSHGTCPTVSVKSSEHEGGFLVVNESDFDPKKHERYLAPPPAAAAPLPPPPAPGAPDPLAGLPKDWQTSKKTGELKDLAVAVSGRTPENREQAVAIIVEALAAKK